LEEDEDFEPRSELDIYLAEGRVQCGSLMYWQANKTRFPLLARMARDFAVQPTGRKALFNSSI
jgi:hypothetical protein